MYLGELLDGVQYRLIGEGNPDVTSLSCDTRTVKEGCLFICIKGRRQDGHNFFRKALGDGCAALVTERPLETKSLQIVVEDSRAAMSRIAKNFYGHCADKLKIISVTGTNGKTSTCRILRGILECAGVKTGVIGTNGVYFGGQSYPSALTTPDPIQLHYWFRQMYLCGVQTVVMEASAHAIALKKLLGVRSELAVFTNFSQDHLDFFGTMHSYAQAKENFFCEQYVKNALVNADDILGQSIAAKFPHTATYGIRCAADVTAKNVREGEGQTFEVEGFGQRAEVHTPLCGTFNVYNALAAISAAMLLGVDVDTCVKGVEGVKEIAGRNETFFRSDGMRVVVDFAHTPDGVENILRYLRGITKGSLIVVFGCGGNRDKFKRPLIAEKVSQYADFALLTNDNPRYESPKLIAQDAASRLSCDYKIILNRSQATEFAFSVASSQDTVALLGKGAEQYQEVRGRKFPYSDSETVRRLMEEGVSQSVT